MFSKVSDLKIEHEQDAELKRYSYRSLPTGGASTTSCSEK